jgi:putative ABC transport system permease protein
MLRRAPVFSTAVIATLALGIAAVTIITSVGGALLLHPMPYHGADRFVYLGEVPFEAFRDFQSQSTAFDGIVGARLEPVTISTPAGVELARGVRVTPEFFQVLGVAPHLGRAFGPHDAAAESPRVAVLRYRTWMTHFNGDPGVLGRIIRVNGEPLTIVGVMPPRFTFQGADVWVSGPIAGAEPATADPPRVSCYARLKLGSSVEEAEAQVTLIAARRSRADPGHYPEPLRFKTEPLVAALFDPFRPMVYVGIGAVSLLLVIACSNVASLLLARMSAREREMTIRAAMGAGRGRLVRQVLVEGFTLACIAVIGGCILAYGGIGAVVYLLPADALPSEVQFELDTSALMVAVAAGALSAVLFSAAPSLHGTRRELLEGLRGGGRTTASAGGWLRHGLLVGEVAVSLVLLATAGLLARSFTSLISTESGVDASKLLVMTVLPAGGRPDTPADQQRFMNEALPRIAGLPAIEGAAATEGLPPGPAFFETRIEVPGRAGADPSTALLQFCTEEYFRTVGLRLLRGRVFSRLERDSRAHVALVNDALVRRWFGAADPIGQHVTLEQLGGWNVLADGGAPSTFEVIGVVADAKNQGLRAPIAPQVFLPGAGYTLVVRTAGDPMRVQRVVDATIRAAGRYVDGRSVTTLQRAIELTEYSRPRFATTIITLFAVTGTMLVMVGIFGVFAYTVSRETRQIAVRKALGATDWSVMTAVLGREFSVILLGLAVGLLATLAVGHFVDEQLWVIGPRDPVTLFAAVCVLTLAAMSAAYVPARRATRVDPLVALREE